MHLENKIRLAFLYPAVVIGFASFGYQDAPALSPSARHTATADALTPASEVLEKMLHHAPAKASFTDRITHFSDKFLGAKFLDAALGDGAGSKYDQAPLYRTDAFDCTTFVETVMALSVAKTLPDFEKHLKHIRYKNGEVSFTARNHFPCADWIPNNVAAGYVTDITAKVAGTLGVVHATAVVSKKGWYENLPPAALRVPRATPAVQEKLLGDLRAEGRHFTDEKVTLPYIPFDKIMVRKDVPEAERERRKQEEGALVEKAEVAAKALPEAERAKHDAETHTQLVNLRLDYVLKDADIDEKFLDKIPSGTVLNVVKPNWKIPGSHMNVSHQGLVLWKSGHPYFRHVSRSGGERVKDVLLANYLRLCLLSPQVKGINLLQINER